MKPFARYTLLALAAAVLAFGATWLLLRPDRTLEADEMAWIEKEFRLTPAQTATIGQLHDDYHPVCMEHCKLIMQARGKLAEAPGDAAAQAELARLEAVCREATLAHLQRVAAVMSPEQGERFLALVAPKVSGQSHDAPLGLK